MQLLWSVLSVSIDETGAGENIQVHDRAADVFPAVSIDVFDLDTARIW